MLIIYMRHVRAAKYCAAGARSFFAKHNFDFQDFLKNGIMASKLIETKDSMAARVVEIAENERRKQERTNNRL